jgi:hypothetical protein
MPVVFLDVRNDQSLWMSKSVDYKIDMFFEIIKLIISSNADAFNISVLVVSASERHKSSQFKLS